jgi:hypothetical protein
MTNDQRKEMYERTMSMLRPALERIVSDPDFRQRLELKPLAALTEVGVELAAETRKELEGKRFSEFWAARRRSVEGPVEVRDLPPQTGALGDRDLENVSGGLTLLNPSLLQSFAPPYVPVAPILSSTTLLDPYRK